MNLIAVNIINEAKKWTDCKEDPSTPNRSVCVDKIHAYMGVKSATKWCAEFVWMITDTVFKWLGIATPIKKTSSTFDMYSSAKKAGLRVDNIPAAGAVFFKNNGDGSGHVGFVAENKGGGKFATIEGNYNNKVGFGLRSLADYKYQFIHIEDLYNQYNPLSYWKNPYVLGGLALAGAAYWYYKKKHKK
jgi:hypothetical protein